MGVTFATVRVLVLLNVCAPRAMSILKAFMYPVLTFIDR
jgi:hypothetical protein